MDQDKKEDSLPKELCVQSMHPYLSIPINGTMSRKRTHKIDKF